MGCQKGKEELQDFMGSRDGIMIEKDAYFLEHLEEAIQQGHIQVYYQPIVRTLTEEVCGMEALVRWKDDKEGIVPPNRFLPVLEREGRLYELDRAVLREICRMFKERIAEEKPVVPVSINLSWQDFLREDTFRFFERTLADANLQRNLVRIELGEKSLVDGTTKLKRAIDQFREAGYQVWLDDFGGEYSSLHTLKDFDVDLIKLDMRFLSAFTEKAQKIVTSIVNMAKELGIRTLAEGAERAEHVLFLHEIGCEMVQGYYYGSPMPMERLETYVNDRGLSFEEPKWGHYYTHIGACIRTTQDPLSILEYDGKRFRGYYANEACRKQLASVGYDGLYESVQAMNEPDNVLYDKFRSFIEAPRRSGQEEVFFYTNQGSYMRTAIQLIAEAQGRSTFRVVTMNLTLDRRAKEKMQLDKALRHVYQMFDSIHTVDLRRDKIAPLFTNNVSAEGILQETTGTELALRRYMGANLHADDQQRFFDFLDPETLMRHLREQRPHHMLSDIFRVKNREGNFVWKEFSVVVIPESRWTRALVCVKDISVDRKAATIALMDELDVDTTSLSAQHHVDELHDNAMLWKCLMQTKRINFFWKDKDLRFRGASRGFLDTYGFKSVHDILGKTDAEVGWHVNDDSMHRAELAVVQEGVSQINQQGECIIHGSLRPIMYTKRPVYDHGEIVGLIGIFEDMQAIEQRFNALSQSFLSDDLTGLLNATGCVQALFRYQQERWQHGLSYGMVLLHMKSYDLIVRQYGDSAGKELLWSMADGVLAAAGPNAIVARLSGATFAILRTCKDPDEMEELAEDLRDRLQDIHHSLGDAVTVRIETKVLMSGTGDITPQTIYQTAWNDEEENAERKEPKETL